MDKLRTIASVLLLLTGLWSVGCSAGKTTQPPAARFESTVTAAPDTFEAPPTDQPSTKTVEPEASATVTVSAGPATAVALTPDSIGSKAEEQPGERSTATPIATPGALPPIVAERPAVSSSVDDLAAKLRGLDLEEFFELSYRELMLRDPELVIEVGLGDVYGLEQVELTNISDAYIRETQQMYVTILDLLRQYDRNTLTPEQQISYDVYEWYLEDQVRGAEFTYFDYPATYFPVTAVHERLIQFFTDLHPVTSEQDAKDYVTRLRQVDAKFEQLLEGLALREEAGKIPPKFAIQWALYGLHDLTGADATRTPFYGSFQEKVNELKDIGDAEKEGLLADARQAISEAVLPAYQDLRDYLAQLESIAPTDEGVWRFSKGDEYYAYLLHHYTTTNLTPEEIHELGLEELQRIHAEMRTIFDELGYGVDESLPELFDQVARDSGRVSGSKVLETYTALIERADRDLDAAFDLRPKAEVTVVGDTFGGYYVPGSMDGSRPGVFYAGVGGEGEERYGMPTLAFHEAIPGHHLQIGIAQELELPSFRREMSFTGYTEGWALYAERLAWELGWYEDDPYGNLGRLQAEAFRAARLVVDTGIHTKGWTFDQALDFFIKNVGYDSGDIVNPQYEIARYIVWPGQATAYKVGMLKILDLRQKAMDQLGDQFDLKEFHRQLLGNGSMPLGILERVVDDYIETKLDQRSDDAADEVSIAIVYDNNTYDPRLVASWGFGAFIEYGARTILFDTGGDGPTLLENMRQLNLAPQTIDAVVLSHIHEDHTGGLRDLLASGVKPKVYVPAAFPAIFKEEISAHTELIQVTGPLEIYPGVYSTGEMGLTVVEQALVMETQEGIVVVTGCAHPGVTRMVRRAKEIVEDDVALVMGGFHLRSANRGDVQGVINELRELGVKQIAPTHCTGELAISLFDEAFGEAYIQAGVGRVILLETALSGEDR